MRPLKQLKRTSFYFAIVFFRWLFNVLPRHWALAIGSALGKLVWHVAAKARLDFTTNLAIAYGDTLSQAERESLCRDFFIKSGRNVVDVLRFRSHLKSELLPLIKIEGLEHWQNASQSGNGLFGITGHIGNFELLAACMHAIGPPVAAIGRELYDARLDSILIENRRIAGLTNIATTDSPRRIIDWLKRGNAVGVLIDTESSRVRSLPINLFGQPTNVPIGQSILGLRLGASFCPIACLRTEDDTFKVIIMPKIDYVPSDDFDQDVRQVTESCIRALEQVIDKHKDQWIWMHYKWARSATVTRLADAKVDAPASR